MHRLMVEVLDGGQRPAGSLPTYATTPAE
jgi:hypothetical protein